MSAPRRFCLLCERDSDEPVCPTHLVATIPGDFFDGGAEPIPDEYLMGGRYRLSGVLGRGANASVHRATQLGLGRDVAVKVVRAERLEDTKRLLRFYREAQTLLRLSHPNIVPVIDFGIDDQMRCAFLVMELIDGRTLDEVLDEEGSLRAPRADALLGQLARALLEAHHAGVVHRDLKPSNVLIRTLRDGTELLRVVDFGLARVTHDGPALTTPGTLLGSPLFMSPEQVRRELSTEASDVYAFGCILYLALTGDAPFRGETLAELFNAHLLGPTPTLPERLPDGTRAPASLTALVRGCLRREPSERPTMAQVVAMLGRPTDVPPELRASAEELVVTDVSDVAVTSDALPAIGSDESRITSDTLSALPERPESPHPLPIEASAPEVSSERGPTLEPSPSPALSPRPIKVDTLVKRAGIVVRPKRHRARGGVAAIFAALAVLAILATFVARRGPPPPIVETPTPEPIPVATAPVAPTPIEPPRVRIETHPSRAEVERDGSVLGHTPLEVQLGPGDLTLRLHGHRPEVLRGEALSGRTRVEVTLEPSSSKPAKRPPRPAAARNKREPVYPVW
ncbi:MAG: protein kinase [Deltaproteobacteria bacterium]|nr:protein kinase [Deltaproteobacteria bacterium]